MSYENIREEELKNQIAHNYFSEFDCRKIIGNVDFCVAPLPPEGGVFDVLTPPSGGGGLLWAEAKKGIADIYKALVQLILTIGKARTFDKYLPPAYLGAFDAQKIAFIPYNDIHDIFYLNDFNWNVTPSNHESKEFQLIYDKVKSILDQNTLLYFYGKDDKELKQFIQTNFVVGKFGITKTRIDKNNFIVIYNKWLQTVKPTIAVNWDLVKKGGIIDADFYLADLLSLENKTLKEKLFVLLEREYYELDRKIDEWGIFNSRKITFKDNLKAHTLFWNKYERPPKEEYWDYIINRRDLLVPQDVRERKGSFFTPQIWVELSQKYLTDVLGEDWQDEYYIWDCAAGTGNLLTGLTNKHHIWASTLDKQDVDVMHDRIKNGANLLEDHVFQFDFLNDSFDKLPKGLQNIINSPEKRKKLVVYINPPYAESNGRISITRSKVQVSRIHTKYQQNLEKVGAELFAQFLIRIYFEIQGCFIGQFSTLKAVSAVNSKTFRNSFLAKLEKLFVVPANTFDNVKGKFPIGFFIWDTKTKEKFEQIEADVFNANGKLISNKIFRSYENEKGRVNNWLLSFKDLSNNYVGVLMADAPDFQHKNLIAIQSFKGIRHGIYFPINSKNLIIACIYVAVRHCIEATWLNDRDQFIYPNEDWQKDKEFQNDCLAFTLFHSQNKISSKAGTNHWIPFTEAEVDARDNFESNFMSKFIKGKLKIEKNADLMNESTVTTSEKLVFSPEAQAVFVAGLALWKYYHQAIKNIPAWQIPPSGVGGLVNASLYDIREYFQGRNATGKMNNKSEDETYTKLIADLREALKVLSQKIEPKVYEYGFLKG
jgi:hypothetical protein